jgi:hypothetical protein
MQQYTFQMLTIPGLQVSQGPFIPQVVKAEGYSENTTNTLRSTSGTPISATSGKRNFLRVRQMAVDV